MDRNINSNIFREYDIRGIVEKDFKPDVVIAIGKAFATYLIKNKQYSLSISGDIRYSTSQLKNDIIKGVVSCGVDVYDMGVLPTPANYFSLFNSKVHHSIQITGSHNPSNYNGFKISFNKKPFYGKSIQKLKNIIINNSFKNLNRNANVFNMKILGEYKQYLYNSFKFTKNFKVSMDCGNASACIVAPELFKKLGIKLKEIYCDINPDFPNHHPDPTIDSNLKELVENVKKNNSDLGIAFDGDADRLIVVDERGRIIRSDILLSLFVSKLINKDDKVVYDVKCSKALEDTILKHEGIPVMWKTGHSLIKNKMIELNSKIGGEMSGHIFFADYYFGYDDAIYVSLRLLEILSNTNKCLSELIDEIPRYVSTHEIRIDCANDNEKFEIVKLTKDFFIDKYSCSEIDGIRIKFNNGWGLLRASNTQPVLVCRFEANNYNNLQEYKNIVINKIKSFSDLNIDV